MSKRVRYRSGSGRTIYDDPFPTLMPPGQNRMDAVSHGFAVGVFRVILDGHRKWSWYYEIDGRITGPYRHQYDARDALVREINARRRARGY